MCSSSLIGRRQEQTKHEKLFFCGVNRALDAPPTVNDLSCSPRQRLANGPAVEVERQHSEGEIERQRSELGQLKERLALMCRQVGATPPQPSPAQPSP